MTSPLQLDAPTDPRSQAIKVELPPKARRIIDRARLAVGNPKHKANAGYLKMLCAYDEHGHMGAVKRYNQFKLSAMIAGVDRATIKAEGRVLSQIVKPGSDPRSVAKRDRWEDREYERGLRKLDPTEWHAQVADTIARTDWSGRTGHTDQLVFKHAADEAARKIDRICWASKRRTAEGLKMSDQTVRNGWERNVKRGLLTPVYSHKVIGCRQTPDGPKDIYAIAGYEVNLLPASNSAAVTPDGCTRGARVLSGVITSIDSHAVFGAKGVGVRGRLCHQLLADGAKTFEELFAGMGYRCKRSLRRHLQREVDLRLVRTRDGWTYALVPAIQLAKDAAAQASGAAQAHEQHCKETNYERKWFRYGDWLREQLKKKYPDEIGPSGNLSVLTCIDDEAEFFGQLASWRMPWESRYGVPQKFKEAVDNGLMAA